MSERYIVCHINLQNTTKSVVMMLVVNVCLLSPSLAFWIMFQKSVSVWSIFINYSTHTWFYTQLCPVATFRLMIEPACIKQDPTLCPIVSFNPYSESDALTTVVRVIETLRLVKTQIHPTCSITHVEGTAILTWHQGHTTCHSAV